MKFRIQLTPALGAALIGSLLWVAFWLTAFRPAAMRPPLPARENAALQPADVRSIPSFSAPTLFALPSEEGFSDRFPPDRIALALRFDPPEQQQFFLEPDRIREGDPNPAPLFQAAPLSRTELHPLDTPARPEAQPGLRLSFSSGVQKRAGKMLLPTLLTDWPDYTRAQIRVEPDGKVSHCFFETPLENSALSAEIRSLRFAPAATHTDGWIELRYTPEEDL